MESDTFDEFFKSATGFYPYPYQKKLALDDRNIPELIHIPTGIGKTAAIILGWLWRRRFHDDDTIRTTTPRRLVYCLPMRVLVEQTTDNATRWLDRLGLLGGTLDIGSHDARTVIKGYKPSFENPFKIVVTTLLGGEVSGVWDLYPERDAIIIGTQDMLLSRALNRGYGMSRYRWAMHFGLLNNDSLWVMDEVQLMGAGLSTGAQMEAFRAQMGTMECTNTKTLWMSATLKKDWLKTVDFNPENLVSTTLTPDDLADQNVRTRFHAVKTIKKCVIDEDETKAAKKSESKKIVAKIIEHHREGTRTLVVLNTVRRAMEIYSGLKTVLMKKQPAPRIVLVHSHFRPVDRKERVNELLAEPGMAGTIIISTQVIEAGVDVSARTLFTDLAPWSSLVQRFGRCNRYGEYEESEIFWIDVPTGEKSQALPYTDEDLNASRTILATIEGHSASPDALPSHAMPLPVKHVIRKKDIIELFDTTPDLTGHDTDISRFIRESTDTDVHVFWRKVSGNDPTEKEPLPTRDELCPAPIKDVRDLVNVKNGLRVWHWDFLEERWSRVRDPSQIFPGLSLMLNCKDGCYLPAEGWAIKSKVHVPVIPPEDSTDSDKGYGDNSSSAGNWQTIAEHSDEVWNEMNQMAHALGLPDRWMEMLLEGIRWHDAGKAHRAFQAMIAPEELRERPPGYIAAKAPKGAWRHDRIVSSEDGRRRYFRHELASGILALLNGKPDLVAYLAAAHHGKVRLSIRSMPDEYLPGDKELRFARGVWDQDAIPGTDLGGGVVMPDTRIDLSYMDLGDGTRGQSWLARMLALRDREDLGIFRLAFMEALVKAADERASMRRS
ncbi:MAG: CRISPR-associated helicase Cas3' [Methanoregula sp.]